MKTNFNALFIILCLPLLCMAQPKYPIMGVKVIKNGKTLSNAWAGGFNNPVFSPIDLNQDGLMDMFVYDRVGWKSMAFLNTGWQGHPSYTYAPMYDTMFPNLIIAPNNNAWAQMRDYNHDGVADMFSLWGNAGMNVYKGHRDINGSLSYSLEYSPLKFSNGANRNPVYTFQLDMPVLMDVDGDGDMDILNAIGGSGGGQISYFQNQAVEMGLGPDTLVYVDAGDCWGHFTYYGSGNGAIAALHTVCKKDLHSGSSRHNGASIFGFHYHEGSHLTDILLGDVHINNLKFLQNYGDTSDADIGYVDTLFPSYNTPVSINSYPAAYGIDVDNDGREDLLISPNNPNYPNPSFSEDINTVQYYHNKGLNNLNEFEYRGDTLFTNDMIDVGTHSHPLFFDYNGDGLMDMVIGNYGRLDTVADLANSVSGRSRSFLTAYQNIGTDTMPIYQLADTDWSHLSIFKLVDIYPAFGDMNGDGKTDMVVGDVSGYIHFFQNTSTGSAVSYPSMTNHNWFNIHTNSTARPFLYDVNGDGLMDIVLGCSGGAPAPGSPIYYFWNYGTATNPMFSQDSVNAFFGKVQVWSAHWSTDGNSSPFIKRENGHDVLYTGSWNSKVYKFAIAPDSLRSGSFALLDTDVLRFPTGSMSTVSIADINHDGKNDYLIGTSRGGVMLFSDTPWAARTIHTFGVTEITAETSALQIFPNPARDKVVCRLSHGEQLLNTAEIYDMLGHIITSKTLRADETGITLETSNVPDGIYIIQASDRSGRTYKSKVAIIK
jgi:hypothetical protein